MKLSAIAAVLSLPFLSYGAALTPPSPEQCVTIDDVECWHKILVKGEMTACMKEWPPVSPWCLIACARPSSHQPLANTSIQLCKGQELLGTAFATGTGTEPAPPAATKKTCPCYENYVPCPDDWPEVGYSAIFANNTTSRDAKTSYQC